MKQSELVAFVVEAADRSAVSCMVGGSVACMNYMIPRATKDFNLVIQIQEPQFTAFLQEVDSQFRLDPQVYVETLTGTKRHILKHRTTAFDVELFILSEDPHHLSMWSRKRLRRQVFCTCDAWTATAEDMIIQKLRWARPQDLVDADSMIGVQGDELDWPYIEHWCDLHGTRDRLEKIREDIPPME